MALQLARQFKIEQRGAHIAHGDARQIGECVLRPGRPRRESRSWRAARSYLAYDVLDLTDLEFTLTDLQASVLIPLELEMAARDDVCGWTARQWVDLGFTAEAAKCTGKHQSVMIDMKIGT